ncbi:hypothetical protein [Octadecabacter sp. R77987]|uniref:hypothetical protein n=1 Tax=Octadecabacter sp. R77987 TaxID=3093874 RepID=UPI00366C6854
MTRLAVSAVYVAANLIASLIIVVLIVRSGDEPQAAQFFLFQAVFFPLTALLSQFRMQLRFRMTHIGRGDATLDIAAFVLGVALLRLIGAGMIPWFDTLLYALAIPLTFRGTTTLAGLQFDRSGIAHAAVPALTAVSRLGMVWLLLQFGGPVAFLGGSVLFAVVPAIAARWSGVAQARPPAFVPARGELVWLLAFFAVTGFTFQWDRYMLSHLDLQTMIIVSGVCATWVLSPISTLFAVIYRADARAIFDRERRAFDTAGFVRRVFLFCGAGLAYGVFVLVAWQPLNAVAFPAVNAPVILPSILIGAVMCDRIGLLFLYMTNRVQGYRLAFVAKLVLVAVAAALCLFGPWEISLMVLYIAYAGSAAAFAFLMGAVRK